MSGDLLEPLSVGVPSGGHQETHVALVDKGVGDLWTRAVGLEVGSHEAFESEGPSSGDAPDVKREVPVGFVGESGQGVEILLVVGFDDVVDEHSKVVFFGRDPRWAITERHCGLVGGPPM